MIEKTKLVVFEYIEVWYIKKPKEAMELEFYQIKIIA